MVKKLQKQSAEKKKSRAQLSSTVKESAQQIWLAGLGAFSKAQEEGSKVFESLVKEGLQIQRKTHSAAEEKMSEATSRVTSMAVDMGAKAQGQWDKLENIFEDRVSKALGKLGVPSARDLQALSERVDALAAALQQAESPPRSTAPAVARPPSAPRARKRPAAPAAGTTPVAKTVRAAQAKPATAGAPPRPKKAAPRKSVPRMPGSVSRSAK